MLPAHVNPPTNGLHRLQSRRSASASPSKHMHRRTIVSIVAAALTFMTVAALFFLFIHWYRKLLKHRRSNKTSPEDGSSLKICRFKYRQLKVATKCFSETHKLGKGGFGVVYRGVLKNGKEVAVKRLDLSSFQGEREFQNELTICSRLHSSRVVRLLGFCTHGKRVRLLVYECMQNRSLQEALFEKGYHTHLDWDKRLKIIVDIARALEFLHLHCDPPIIHGDVKPSNVLLDSNFSARIADFGLARFKTTPQEVDATLCTSVEKVKDYSYKDCKIDTPLAAVGGSSPNSMVKNPHRKSSCMVFGKAHSVKQSLLISEITSPIRVSVGDRTGGPDDATAALSTPCFSPSLDNVGVQVESQAGLPGCEGGQKDQLKDIVNVCQDVEICSADNPNEWSGSMPLEFCSKEMGPPTLHTARHDSNGDLMGKGYVLNWLGSDVQRQVEKHVQVNEESIGAKGWSRLHGLDVESVTMDKRRAKSTHRRSREWWKEEYFAELSNKNSGNANVKKKRSKTRSVGNWKELLSGELSGDLSGELRGVSKVEENVGSSKNWLGNLWSGDLSWLIHGGDRRWSRAPSQEAASDMWSGELNAGELVDRRQCSGDLSRSGELISRDLSNTTTSLRGTICYVAPEYGGNGVLSEKSDIYSLGVLMLVILSGRRPIQVTASPLKEFERANLISWARYLSQSGKLLDLMDPALHGEYDLQQASICITAALLCLQRVPERRPDISRVVKILLGESMVPQLSPHQAARIHHKRPSQLPKEYHSVTITP